MFTVRSSKGQQSNWTAYRIVTPTTECMIGENNLEKFCISEYYKYRMRKDTGYFARWGETRQDDPVWSPFGPELLDLEISTGECRGRCAFCYKTNGTPKSPTKHMSLETFKHILSVMPPVLTQIAFGITDVNGNPDFFPIMKHSNECGIKPNYTTHGLDLDDMSAERTADYCGAVAVSIVNEEKSFNAIKKFTDAGMKQVNIHFMLSAETIDRAFKIVDKIASDPRLEKMNAIVFLQYKPKGNNTDKFNSVPSMDAYKALCKHCEQQGVAYGFDSCSAPLYIASLDGDPLHQQKMQMTEPCESGLFSAYINVDGVFFACSFAEGEQEWTEGIDVLQCKNPEEFLEKVWYNEKLVVWRERLIKNKRECPIYDLVNS